MLVKFILTLSLLLVAQLLYGQKTYRELLENKNFQWLADSSSIGLITYYQRDSWAHQRSEKVREIVLRHLNSVKSFVDAQSYPASVHLFIVESREDMKLLVGHETNGSAFYETNTITGIASDKINSIYSHHELFHVVAMNVWGVPEVWLNEGMAVYADNAWHGRDLHQLTKYLVDNNRYVSLRKIVSAFRKADHLVSYPLAGSFVKYLDEQYGREALIRIWKGKANDLKKITGKSLKQLESDWLSMIQTVAYTDITY